MAGKSIVIAVLLSMCVSAVHADSSDDAYLKLSANVHNESGEKTAEYMAALGHEYANHVVMDRVLITGNIELYYKFNEVIIEDGSTKKNITGVGLGSLKYIGGGKDDDGFIPYLKFSLERIDTKKVTGSVVVSETSFVYAWTAGIEKKLSDRFTLDIHHLWELHKLYSDEFANETMVEIVYTFPI